MAAVLVVKHLAAAKTRLAASLGTIPGASVAGAGARGPVMPIAEHRELVLAMLLDTAAAVRAAGLAPIVVVSPDDEVLAAITAAGAQPLRERPRSDPSLNHAYAQGTAWVHAQRPGVRQVLMVQADLPAARAASIREVLDAANDLAEALVSDAGGDGTALLLRHAHVDRPPRFGIGSAAAHRDGGAVELDPGHARWPDLRTDVDTAADLDAAIALGAGPHTRRALGLGGVPDSPAEHP
ncbi:2-phospho-L-lactate guanylyltransferase [Gordonia sp. DT219]|uniref:2-phospho-L-lactate guanylyltransferase n=1 Tax=Gordonia sp. DT219 TaxID=3416658 RepID=UPI003CF4F64B